LAKFNQLVRHFFGPHRLTVKAVITLQSSNEPLIRLYECLYDSFIFADGNNLVDVLHARGINLRYLGHLAQLACEQEAEDILMATQGKQRVQLMPTFWLEMLEV
jgi:hypothetical protein